MCYGLETDTLNICFNVLLLHCWSIAYVVALYDVKFSVWCDKRYKVALVMLHFILHCIDSLPFEWGRWFCYRFVPNLQMYVCLKIYQNRLRFDKVITEIIWCNFLCPTWNFCMTLCVFWYKELLMIVWSWCLATGDNRSSYLTATS